MSRVLSSPELAVKDTEGKVRQLSHLYDDLPQERTRSRDAPAAGDEALLELARRYLRDRAVQFGIGPEVTLDSGTLKRAAGQAASVTFAQYAGQWPIWRAGVTVRIDTERMRVTGAHNSAHLGVRLHEGSARAPCNEQGIDAQRVRELLQVSGDTPLRVTRCSTLVYQFTPDNRLPPEKKRARSQASDKPASRPFPAFVLPELPPQVLACQGQHFVVTEVQFTLEMHGRPIHCRAFIEPETGAVLYARALMSGATAWVFHPDPGSLGGDLTPASPPQLLNPCRQQRALQAPLGAPDAAGRLWLAGRFVELVNLDAPPTPMPSQANPFDFQYACDTEDFAACSAYYHCDFVFRLVDELGLGVDRYFTHTKFPIQVDPHAFYQGVNAQALGNADGWGLAQFMFGSAIDGSTFGIASDMRVVLHEFGHAVLWEHIGSPYFPFAHSPGDSLAAILMDPLSRAADRGDTFPFLRHLGDFDRRHDRAVADGWGWSGNAWDHEYGGEQVLSTSLFRVYRSAGGDSSRQEDKVAASRYVVYLILKAISMLHIPPQHAEGLVHMLIEADAMTSPFPQFPPGSLRKVIRWAFEQQGLYRRTNDGSVSLAPGDPPPVDVYVDDARQGGYEGYLADFQAPPGLWNRVAADAGRGHQPPVVGVPNFAYVEVGNRGTDEASGVEVFAFQAADAGQRLWGRDWTAVPGTPLRLPEPIASGDRKVVGPIAWTPAAPQDHLLVLVNAPDDPSLLQPETGEKTVDCFVRFDNNIVERKF